MIRCGLRKGRSIQVYIFTINQILEQIKISKTVNSWTWRRLSIEFRKKKSGTAQERRMLNVRKDNLQSEAFEIKEGLDRVET